MDRKGVITQEAILQTIKIILAVLAGAAVLTLIIMIATQGREASCVFFRDIVESLPLGDQIARSTLPDC